MKKRIALVCALVLTVSVSGLFATGTSEKEPAKTEIQFWTWRPEDVDFYDSVIADFEEANPGIKVVQNAIRNTEYNTVLAASLSGGSGPDIFQTRAYGGLLTFSGSGYLEPIEKWYPDVKKYPEAALGGAKDADGVLWGVPVIGQTQLVYYNKAMYEQYGLAVPQTWSEFLHNCQVLKDHGVTPIANGTKEGWIVETMLGAAGATFYGGNDFFNEVVAGNTTFEDSRFIKAIDKLGELKPYLPPMYTGVAYTDMQASFFNEMAGHFLGGSYEASYFLAQNPDLQFDIFAMPGEKATDPRYVSVYADMNWSINAASTKKEAAAKFLAYLASTEVANRFITELGNVAWAPGADASASPFIQKVLNLQKTSTPYIFLVGFRYQQPTGSQLFQAAGQGYFANEISAAEVADRVQKGIATYYAPFRK